MKKIFLRTTVSVLGLGIMLTAGYPIFSRCHHHGPYSLPKTDEQQTVVSSSSPLRASIQIYLKDSTKEIFDHISNSSSLPQWMPGLANVTYDHHDSIFPGFLGQGSRRTMIFGDQKETETIVQYEWPQVIAYQITAGVPLKNHLAVMTVEAEGDGSILTWHQYFDLERASIYGWLMPFLVRRFLNQAQSALINKFGGETIAACQYRLL